MKKNVLPEIQVSYHRSVPPQNQTKILSSEDAYKYFLSIWNHDTIQLYEEFYALYLTRNNTIIGHRLISRGGIAGTVVDPKIVLSFGLGCGCSVIILAHNHPSGNKKSSTADIEITKRIHEGAKLLDIALLDHLIITIEGWFSFADEGLL